MTAEGLTDFLLARIAEDEDAARRVVDDMSRWDSGSWEEDVRSTGSDLPATLFTARMSPARLLAECEAKRAILAAAWEEDDSREAEFCSGHSREEREGDGSHPLPVFAMHLATIYADHPDYRQEWKP